MFNERNELGESKMPGKIMSGIVAAILYVPFNLLIQWLINKEITPTTIGITIIFAFAVFFTSALLPLGIMFVVFILAITVLTTVLGYKNKIAAEKKPVKEDQVVADVIEPETVYYLDGAEVDGDKINLDLYSYSYDEDTNTYYLTHK